MGVALALLACGDDKDSITPDPAVAELVGTWDAVVFEVTAEAPPNTVVDILSFGAFYVIIEPSGNYQAILEFAGGGAEFGQLTVDPGTSTLTLDPTTGPPTTGTYSFQGDDYLVIDGATEFDFNLDQLDEAASVHLELQRR